MNNLFSSFSFLNNNYERRRQELYPKQLLSRKLMDEENEQNILKKKQDDRNIILQNYQKFGVIRRPREDSICIDEDLFFDLEGYDSNQAQPKDLDVINAQFVRNNQLQINRRVYKRRKYDIE